MAWTLEDLRRAARASAEAAFSYNVRRELRAVGLDVTLERIDVWVYFDGPVIEDVAEDIDTDEITIMVADFPYPDFDDPFIHAHMVSRASCKAVPDHDFTIQHCSREVTPAGS